MKEKKQKTKLGTKIIIGFLIFVFMGMSINWVYIHDTILPESILEKFEQFSKTEFGHNIGTFFNFVSRIITKFFIFIWNIISFLLGITVQQDIQETIYIEAPPKREEEVIEESNLTETIQEEIIEEHPIPEKIPAPEIIIEEINETLIKQIRDEAKLIRSSLEKLVHSHSTLKASVSKLLHLFDELSKGQTIQYNITDVLSSIQSSNQQVTTKLQKTIQDFCDKYVFSNEVILNYIPNKPFVLKSSIKSQNFPIEIEYKKHNLTFITQQKFPYYAHKIKFDPIEENNANAKELEMNFYLQGKLTRSIEKVEINGQNGTECDVKQSFMFDQIVIHVDNTFGEEDKAIVPVIHVYEPPKLHNSLSIKNKEF